MTDLSFAGLCDLLSVKEPTVILFHVRPDGDAVGSAFALRLLLEAAGGTAYCLCGDDVPTRLRFLTDSIQQSVLPDTLPDNLADARIFAVDSASPSQLGKLYDTFTPSLSVDHHGSSQRFCDGYVLPDAAATGEIIYDISVELQRRGTVGGLPQRFYELIYTAISSDTGCFRFSNTTPKTHMTAAGLLSHGIDAAAINHRLFDSKSRSELNAQKASLEKLRTFCNGRIAAVAFSPEELKTLDIDRENYDMFIETARSVEGADVAVSARRAEGDTGVRVSMRSSGNVNVARVCEAFGGGGHIRAAGCTVGTDSPDEALRLIVKETEKQL